MDIIVFLNENEPTLTQDNLMDIFGDFKIFYGELVFDLTKKIALYNK